MALESLFIVRNTKWKSCTPFDGQKGFKKKGVNWCKFFGNYRDEFFKNLHLNSHLYTTEDLWIIDRSCGFCVLFCRHGKVRQGKGLFFGCNSERTGEEMQPFQTGWGKLIKIKHLWKFPLTHFRYWDQVILAEEPQGENSLLWYSRWLSS